MIQYNVSSRGRREKKRDDKMATGMDVKVLYMIETQSNSNKGRPVLFSGTVRTHASISSEPMYPSATQVVRSGTVRTLLSQLHLK